MLQSASIIWILGLAIHTSAPPSDQTQADLKKSDQLVEVKIRGRLAKEASDKFKIISKNVEWGIQFQEGSPSEAKAATLVGKAVLLSGNLELSPKPEGQPISKKQDIKSKIVCLVRSLESATSEMSDEQIQVRCYGKVRHGIVAIGGESTGTTISANGITWELDLGQSTELRQMAEKLNGKSSLMIGFLELRKGLEVSDRWVCDVEKLSEFGKR